ncbi:hypothetical protein [Brevibacterium litoralis]|uniref:hypothetical protein n=1 Tax=Brevibacterium litoralis TaxID=3138935 RepID=UPI0032F02F2E
MGERHGEQSEPVWRAEGFELAVEQDTAVDHEYYRVRSAGGRPGAVVVAVHRGRVLLVEQYRPPERSL